MLRNRGLFYRLFNSENGIAFCNGDVMKMLFLHPLKFRK